MISNYVFVYSMVYLTFCCVPNQLTNMGQALNYKRFCLLDDCPSGQICLKTYCRYTRSLGQACDGVWEICTKNMQCTADASGTKKCTCTIDSDCPDDSWCEKSTCKSQQTNCTKNSDCHSDSHCINGHCIAQRYGKCSSKANCDSGLECIRGKCEYYCPGYGVCGGDFRCYNNIKCLKPTNLHKNCSSSETCHETTGNSICDLRSQECRCSDGYEEKLGSESVFCNQSVALIL